MSGTLKSIFYGTVKGIERATFVALSSLKQFYNINW